MENGVICAIGDGHGIRRCKYSYKGSEFACNACIDILTDLYNNIKNLDEDNLETVIKELKEKQSYWRYWKDIKINEKSLVVDKIAFDMNISSLDYQVKWHEALIENIDEYIDFSNRQEDIIRNVDFGEMEENKGTDLSNGERRILKLREEIIDNSGDVKGKIDELITLLSKKA